MYGTLIPMGCHLRTRVGPWNEVQGGIYMRFLVVFLIGAVRVVCETTVLYVSGSQIVGGNEDLSLAYKIDLVRKEIVPFYQRTEKPTGISDLVTSPDGRKIAVAYMKKSDSVYEFERIIVTPVGELLVSIPTALNCAWSPDSSKLAYVSASYETEEVVPTGVWVYDLETKQSRKLNDRGRVITWAAFDGMIYTEAYVGGNPIQRIDPATGEAEETEYESLDFSPDGKFLFYFDGNHNELILREERTNVSSAYEFIRAKENTSSIKWLTNNAARIGSHEKANHEYLFFCDTGRTYMAPGLILALGKNGESVYISHHTDGEIQELTFDQLELKAEGESPEVIQAKIEALRNPPAEDRSEEHGASTATKE